MQIFRSLLCISKLFSNTLLLIFQLQKELSTSPQWVLLKCYTTLWEKLFCIRWNPFSRWCFSCAQTPLPVSATQSTHLFWNIVSSLIFNRQICWIFRSLSESSSILAGTGVPKYQSHTTGDTGSPELIDIYATCLEREGYESAFTSGKWKKCHSSPPLKGGKWIKICGAGEATRQSSIRSSLRHFQN